MRSAHTPRSRSRTRHVPFGIHPLFVVALFGAAALSAAFPEHALTYALRSFGSERSALRSPRLGAVEEESSILLSWSTNPNASEYVVFVSKGSLDGRSADDLMGDANVSKTATTRNAIRLQEVVRGDAGTTEYSWAVAARDGGNSTLELSEVSSFSAVKSFTGGSPASALIRETARGVTDVPSYGDGAEIRLTNGVRFDPVRDGDPEMPPALRARAMREGETGSFIVQTEGPVRPGQIEAIAASGAAVVSYLPNYAFLVRMDAASRGAVEALPFVRWVGAYHPAYKLSAQREMSEPSGARTLTLLLFPDADVAAASSSIQALGGTIVEVTDSGRNKIVRATIDMARVVDLAAKNEVAWIEPWHELRLNNNQAQWVVQTNASESRRVWDMGIRGEGQVIQTSDSGIRTTHQQFRDGSVPISNFGDFPTHRKIIAYKPTILGAGVVFGDNAAASYHGTHTAGTAIGDDSPFAADNRDGMAPKAKIYFSDGGSSGTGIIAPSDLNLLFQPAYDGNAGGGARISSGSWSAATAGDYTVLDMTADQFMWDHRDFLTFFSTGNDGTPSSCGSPSNCKNGVGSGATANGAASGQMMPLTSQGPTADGRLKPTILSPGLQLSSASGASDNAYQALTGTSMSCPSKAGATLLIRQYLTEGWYPTGAATPANAFTPSGALLKAMAISSTDNDMSGLPIPNTVTGWGRIKADNILFFPGDAARTALVDQTEGVATGEFIEYEINVTNSTTPLKIALCWYDKEGNPAGVRQLVNDLDLTVTDPLSVTYIGNAFAGGESAPAGLRDTINVEECVRKTAPLAGTWTVRVTGTNIPFSPQPFALAISGAVGGDNGIVQIDRTSYGSDDVIEIRVEDTNAGSPISVSVSSDTESSAETVSIPGSGGVFVGTIATTVSSPASDGEISLSHGDAITVTYTDANPAATRIATATADLAGPVLTNVAAASEDLTATITWSSDGVSSSQVHYGTTPSLGQSSTLDPNLVLSHSVVLSGLTPETDYYFDVESEDRVGNATRDDAGGNHYRFRTRSSGDIVLVIGDGTFTQTSTYTTALRNRGWDPTVLQGGTIATPLVGNTSAGLRSKTAVWWQVGSEQYPPFEDSARDSLTKYLDGGGRLSVVSHDVAWAFSEPTSGFYTAAREAWIESHLHINWLEDPATWPAIFGYANDPISGSYAAGLVYSPLRPGGSGDEVSIVAGTGTGAFVWQNTDTSPDNIAIRWENGVNNGSADSAAWGGKPTRVVTNCLEWTSIVDAAAREDILDKTLIWLIGNDHPDAVVTAPNGGETITSGPASISWTETVFGSATIAARSIFYSSDGGASWNLITAGAGPSPYSWDITGLPNATSYRVRVRLTDNGSPALRGEDASNANFTINQPGGDLSGPVVVAGSIMANPNPMDNESANMLAARLTDVGFGSSNVAAAEWSRGANAAPAGSGTAMTGTFTASTVDVSATVPGFTIPTGQQTFWVRGRDAAGNWGNATSQSFFVNGNDQVAVEGGAALPARFALEQNFPNPFNPSTMIRYALPEAGEVTLAVYNAAGEKVRTLEAGFQPAGYRAVHWDGKNDAGKSVTSGVYMYRLDADEFESSRKMVLVK